MSDFHQNQLLHIKKFVQGQMNDSEASAFEKEMESDPFLREAVEGFQKVKGSIHGVDALKQEGLKNSSAKLLFKSILVIAVLIGAYFTYLNFNTNSDSKIAEKKPVKTVEPTLQPDTEDLSQDTIENYKVILSKETDTSVHIAVGSFKEDKVIPNENFMTVKSIEKKELKKLKSIDFDPIEIEEFDEEIEESYNYIFIEDYKLFNYLLDRDSGIKILKPILNGVPASKENDSSEDPFQDYIYENVPYHEYLRTAVIELSQENHKKAYKMFSKILEVYPDDVNASFYSAYCSFVLKKYRRAQNEFLISVELNNNLFEEEAKYHLALSAYENKEIDLTKELLNEIVLDNGFYSQAAAEFLKLRF